MSASSDRVVVRVPGSTSNCGAGFDSLGIALKVYNQVSLARRAGTSPCPERASDARAAEMVAETATAFFRSTGLPPHGFAYRIDGDVPPARGLGSSVTVIAGVLAGLNALLETRLSKHDLVAIATELEGHPDNASAGILGGFCASRCDPNSGAYIDSIRATVPDSLVFAVVSPDVELLTKESRGALPSRLDYRDAVRSINSATYLTAAFVSGDYARLRGAVSDFMHEPYRLPRIHGAREAIDAGVAAGAYAGWLSGSGSSVLCVSETAAAEAAGQAMLAAFARVGLSAKLRLLAVDNDGLALN